MLVITLLLAFTVIVTATWSVSRRIWHFHVYAAKYLGLWLLDRTGLLRFALSLRSDGRRESYQRASAAELLRRFCEDMGPTFVKFGQIIGSSAGLFPPALVEEFGRCLDRVKPISFDEVKQTIEDELGERASDIHFVDPEPLASASIAQVHAATLEDGTDVVVKVQRPGIEQLVRADVEVMRWVAKILVLLVRESRAANPVAIVDDFAATLSEELDFKQEAENLARFNDIMKQLGHADIRAPVPQFALSTTRVLVMERFHGTRIDDVEAIRKRGIDAEAALIRGLRAWFQTVVLHGFFHGDVHAGNLFLLDNGDTGFLDFGIVGRFDDVQRQNITNYLLALLAGDYARLAEVLVEMGGAGRELDLNSLSAGLSEIFSPLMSLSFKDIDPADIAPRINKIAREQGLMLPREFVLITKQILYFDRYARLLAPNLNIFTDPRLIAGMAGDIHKVRTVGHDAEPMH